MAQPMDRSGLEGELREAILTGEPVDRRVHDREADHPAHGADWDLRRTIPADVLADLLTSPELAKLRCRPLALYGAGIVGRLDLEDAELICSVKFNGCWFQQAPVFTGSQLATLHLTGCHLPAFDGQQLRTRGNLELNDGFTSSGTVDLRGADIGGLLSFEDATLVATGRMSLLADGLTVKGALNCHGLRAQGTIRLLLAHVGETLNFSAAYLDTRDDRALVADDLIVDGSVFFRDGFHSEGEVSLYGAHVGDLFLGGSVILRTTDTEGGVTFDVDGSTIDGKMLCEDFESYGQISLRGARIGDQIGFRQALLTQPEGLPLILQELQAPTLLLRELVQPPEQINFRGARIGMLVDDAESWSSKVALNGFVYDNLFERAPIPARTRLEWLGRDVEDYVPQPYEQLIASYRRAGRDQDARTVAIAKQRARRRAMGRESGRHRISSLLSRAWSILLDLLVGYGYRPWLAIVWLAGFVVAGWWLFDRAHDAHLLTAPEDAGERPWFYAAVYALDLLLPFADLGYQGTWIANGWARPWFLVWSLVGWILITAILAAVSGLIKRD